MRWDLVLLVFAGGLISALATGLGALPFAFVGKPSHRVLGISSSIASGLMLGASFGLFTEGAAHGAGRTSLGAVAGAVMVLLGARLLQDHQPEIADLHGAGARKALLVLGIMTLHSFSEGVAVGVSFGGGRELATLITLAIAVHNIPEGLAISAVMRPRGASLLACGGWSIFSSLPQPLMAVPAFLFVEVFRPFLPVGLGFAGGAMVVMVAKELLPDALKETSGLTVSLWTVGSLVAMLWFQSWL